MIPIVAITKLAQINRGISEIQIIGKNTAKQIRNMLIVIGYCNVNVTPSVIKTLLQKWICGFADVIL